MPQEESDNVRSLLKLVRDPSKTAFDLLPTGETLGSFANRHVVEAYVRQILMKRETAQRSRERNRNQRLKKLQPKKKKV